MKRKNTLAIVILIASSWIGYRHLNRFDVNYDGIIDLKDVIQVHKKGILSCDLNRDGLVDSYDIQLVKAHILGHIELKGTLFDQADLNKDGEIDVKDITPIKRHRLGLEVCK